MDEQQTWVEALNINPEMLNEWSSSAPAGKPLLVWCLEQGHVSVTDYLQWASEAFGAPVLSSAFFEGGLDRAYLENIRHQEIWSPWFFAVNEWDGLTHVACVELPPKEDRPAGVCYVLADPRAMAEAWEMTGTGTKHKLDVANGDVPPPLEEGPMGITLKAKPFKLNLDETGLMIGLPDAPMDAPSTSPSPPAVPNETALTRISSEPTVVGHVVPPNLKLDDGLTGLTLVKPELSESQTALIDSAPPTAIHRMPVVGEDLKLNANESEALNAVFASLGKTYGHTCVVRFTADSTAKLYKWSPSLNPPEGGKKAEINLSYPSFLRIVLKTSLPYHGYLVDSPTHKDFFEGLGLKDIPACVTAVPIKVNGAIWGIVLSLGSEVLQSMDNLATVTSATEQLVSVLAPVWAKVS